MHFVERHFLTRLRLVLCRGLWARTAVYPDISAVSESPPASQGQQNKSVRDRITKERGGRGEGEVERGARWGVTARR